MLKMFQRNQLIAVRQEEDDKHIIFNRFKSTIPMDMRYKIIYEYINRVQKYIKLHHECINRHHDYLKLYHECTNHHHEYVKHHHEGINSHHEYINFELINRPRIHI